MRVLILGGDGMLGHQLLLNLQKSHRVRVTLRLNMDSYQQYHSFDQHNSYFGIDVRIETDVVRILSDFQPEVVINAVGIVKQRKAAQEAIPSLEINALFPHRLAKLCKAVNVRMIHFSTDCVFSGFKGKYTEEDPSDAMDLYGKSKYLGEVQDSHCITLRTSIIGLELARKTGLIEWFLAQKGSIKGFKRAIYSGLSTQEMSRVIETVLVNYPNLSGVWHVASDAINKYELLKTFSTMLGRDDIHIEEDENFVCDRSLMCSAFNNVTGYKAPKWEDMLWELAVQVNQRNKYKNSQRMTCNA